VNRTIALCLFMAVAAVIVCVSVATPATLSDANGFLKDFVGSQLLGFLGVVVTITLASAANLHFELNKLEAERQKRGFVKTRGAIRQSAAWLIGLLLLAIALLVIKPALGSNQTVQSLANGGALLIVLFNVLVLIDLTQMAFKIGPDLPD
jgi:hypothetical protein